jgi:PAS domain S-box-containing protein
MNEDVKRYTNKLETEITERKKAEEAVRESEEKFRQAFAIGPDGFLLSTPKESKLIDVNESFLEMFGYNKQEVIGKSALKLGLWADPSEREKIALELKSTGKVRNLEIMCRRKNGETFPILLSTTLMQINNQQLVLSAVRDFSSYKKAEDAIRRQAALIDLSPDAIVVMNVEGDATFWSIGAEKLYGWKKSEVLGKNIHELLETKFPEPFKNIMKKLEQAGFWSGELIQSNKDGKEVIVQSRWMPKLDASGHIVEVLKSNVDISDRKKAEEKLEAYRKNLEKLVEERTKKLELSSLYARNLIEASLDPLVTISVEGKITDVNKATELATGRSRQELIGSDFSSYFIDPEKAKVGYKKVFTEGIVRDYPLAIMHRNGTVIDVLYNATVYRNAAGDVQGVFAAARDITELRKAEKEAQEAAKKMKDSERLAAIGATAGMVGHDIRNPLQAITSDVYLAKTDLAALPESEEKKNVQESLEEIGKNTAYINKIVADLQDFARPLTPKIEETDLKQIIISAIANLFIPENVIVEQSVNENFPKLKTDPSYIQRILTNLANNAIQAMPNGGKLTITAVHKDNKAVINVEDTGMGIPESVRSKIFTPLVTTKSKGQGFGLSVAKRFTEALGGTVTFESEVGKGTKFTINLPLNEKPTI